MKTLKQLSFFVFSIVFLAACSQAPDSDRAEVGDALEVPNVSPESLVLSIIPEKSFVSWVGTKPTGRNNGTIKITVGEIAVIDDVVSGGNFTIDMTTLDVLNMNEENNIKLATHLMSADFFTVDKYPLSKFELISTEPLTEEEINAIDHPEASLAIRDVTHRVTGNLTMLDATRSVTFPARIKFDGERLHTLANFNIDRTDWGITYGNDRSLGDNFIRPIVNIGLDVTAEVTEVIASNE